MALPPAENLNRCATRRGPGNRFPFALEVRKIRRDPRDGSLYEITYVILRKRHWLRCDDANDPSWDVIHFGPLVVATRVVFPSSGC